MKQHAIPQNILDVEFKLFTKFTVREFLYISLGIGFGGIFIYLFTIAVLPIFVALPIFIFSSGFGLLLGLVPINDQKADVFLTNYIRAIRRPTLRVWKSKEFDSKIEDIANEKGLTFAQTTTKATGEEQSSKQSKIIGGDTKVVRSNQFIENSQLASIDLEEAERLRQIEELYNQTELVTQTQPAQPQMAQIEPAEVEFNPALSEENLLQTENRLDTTEYQTDFTPPSTLSLSTITITSENASSHAIQIEGYEIIPNTINFQLVDNQQNPVSQATILVKDKSGSLQQVIQSRQDGLVLINKQFPPGDYLIDIKHDQYTFPSLYYILDNNIIPAVRIVNV